MIEEDKEFVHSYFDMPDEDFPVHRQSPWLLRITLNRDLMVDKKLSLEAIAERINTEFEDELHCIFNDDNAEVPALRVRSMHISTLESCLRRQRASPRTPTQEEPWPVLSEHTIRSCTLVHGEPSAGPASKSVSRTLRERGQ